MHIHTHIHTYTSYKYTSLTHIFIYTGNYFPPEAFSRIASAMVQLRLVGSLKL